MPKDVPYGIYNQEDTHTVSKQINRGLAVAGVFAAIAIAGIVVSFIYRMQWLTIAITLVWGSLTIFFWGMKLSPPLAYRRHLKEIHQGLSRQSLGEVVEFAEDPTFREGLEYYALLINIGFQGDPEDDRLFYWNVQKPRPDIEPGDRVEIISHGNDVIGIHKIAQAGAEI